MGCYSSTHISEGRLFVNLLLELCEDRWIDHALLARHCESCVDGASRGAVNQWLYDLDELVMITLMKLHSICCQPSSPQPSKQFLHDLTAHRAQHESKIQLHQHFTSPSSSQSNAKQRKVFFFNPPSADELINEKSGSVRVSPR